MSKPSRRAETKEATREALVLAATAEMARFGLDNASLDDICERAGFTRGAFYVHFKDRDDLVAAVVDRVISHNQRAILDDGGDGGGDLRDIIGRFVARVAAGDPTAVGTASWRFRHTLAACARVPAVRARYLALQKEGIDRLTAAVRAGQRGGSVRDDVDAAQVASILSILSLGISAAMELQMPLDLLGGAIALERLLTRPPRRPRPISGANPRRARRTAGR